MKANMMVSKAPRFPPLLSLPFSDYNLSHHRCSFCPFYTAHIAAYLLLSPL